MAPTRVSPSKRKHGEVATAAGHGKIISFGARVTKAGGAGTLSGQKVPRELANLGLGAVGGKAATSAAADRRSSRGIAAGLDSQARQTRSTAAAATAAPPTPAAAAAAVVLSKPTPATKARAAAACPARASKPSKGASQPAPASHARRLLSQATLDGETFCVGDSVYVVLDTELVAGLRQADCEEECVCLVCGEADKEERIMLECDRCLAGCHLACLSPPLKEVPEGEWVCPDCASGRAPRRATPSTARDCLLQRHGLGLARIEAIREEPDGELECTYRWYCLPEETHTGRQRHHLAREVFLTQQRDADSMAAILRTAHVLPPLEFRAGGASSALGEDVFVCEYAYDSAWQRFRRCTEIEGESDEDDEGEEWCPAAASESDEEEGGVTTFHPTLELWAERGLMPGGGPRRGGINRRKQGGEEYLAQVGALAVSEHARRRQGQRAASGPLSQAREVLALTAVPRTLPCREAERGQVVDFVKEVLTEEVGRCLYITGIPGTGKTATVLEVMRGLKRRSEDGELPHFQFVEINGLRLPSPQHAYSALYEALTGDRRGPQAAAAALEQMFGGGGAAGGGKGASRRPTIVLVDEMDCLVNKTQTVLYNLFDWPGRKGSRLSLIGIANTMDLPERLHPRIGSRLAGRRIVFQPYSKDQLQEIIKSRLDGLSAFQPNALEFISRKVANCSGDVRRCLELCRRAAEIAEERLRKQRQQQEQAQQQQEGVPLAAETAGSRAQSAAAQQQLQPQQAQQESGMVEMRHVAAAISEMFSTGHVRLLREACRLERLLLAAIFLETTSSGRAECLLEDAWQRLRLLCAQNCEAQRYDFGAVLERAADLGAKRLIICDPGLRRVRVKVALNVSTNDLLMVLSSDGELPWLESVLSRATLAPVAVIE